MTSRILGLLQTYQQLALLCVFSPKNWSFPTREKNKWKVLADTTKLLPVWAQGYTVFSDGNLRHYYPFPKKALLWPVFKKKKKNLNRDVDITSQDDMNHVHKNVERLKNRKGAGEWKRLGRDRRGEESTWRRRKEKLEICKGETMAFVEVAGLKLRVRCHSEAPGCLIFHRVIPALWIGLIALSRPLLCTYPHILVRSS